MPCFLSRSPQAVLAGLLLLAGSAAAQAPQTMPPVAPLPAAPVQAAPMPAAVAPQVTALFNQAIAAHQALSALTATVTLVSTGFQPGANSSQTINLAYKKPGYAKVAVSGPSGLIVQFYSDGKTLTQYIVSTKQYSVQPAPAGAQIIPLMFNQARAPLPRLLGNPVELNELLTQPGVTASIAGSPAGAVTVSGVAVDTVAAVLSAPDGSQATFTFDIGKTDHLLRRLTQNTHLTSTGNPQTFTVTQTLITLRTNPPLTAADFRFTPPPGVTKIVATLPKAGQSQLPGKAAAGHRERPAR